MRNALIPYLLLCCWMLLGWSCEPEPGPETTLFTLTDPAATGLAFNNDLPYTEEFNTYTYRNFYNGGGVALGDINQDGLIDIYFTGNIVDNKLFLNKGNWEFEDITATAQVACSGVWSTGATFVDINGDGLLDIYVCKAGKPEGQRRYNELFINQGDLTFKESAAEYGLDIVGLSIHAAFFDYDRDGDLDCYLLSNSIRSVGGFDLKKGQRQVPDPEGNKLLRNDNGVFRDVSETAGIYSSSIGYGLGITLSDFNQDHWPDLFISNDFFERDYLYLNNQDGTFREVADQSFAALSMGSMGADACDIDNDLQPDLFVTEMLPNSLERKKTKAQYETWDKYTSSAENGYHYQFSRNALQRNVGSGKFLEVGRLSGVAATEWSWASLIQDYDNDGLKDLFISNGIFKDLLDKDYINYFADDAMIRSRIAKNEKVLTVLIDSMPSQAMKNYLYKNEGDFQFRSVADEWGLGQTTFSNGSAYGDLDNDGDLDLIVNNVNMPSFVYRNNVDTAQNRSIQFRLVGTGKNTHAIGTKLIVKYPGGQSFLENYPSRGFESSIDNRLHVGLGGATQVDTVRVIWPNGQTTIKTNLAVNQLYEIRQEEEAEGTTVNSIARRSVPLIDTTTIPFQHRDIGFNLFTRERMLIEMNGFDGPALAIGDVNGDQIDDVYCGGGRNQTSQLFLSQAADTYQAVLDPFTNDLKSEAVKAQFFDVDQDGDQDLYVAHGGKTFSNVAPELNDVLYLNDGKGQFTKSTTALSFPEAIYSGDFAIADFDRDGSQDIVVVEKMKTALFGLPGNGYVLYNDGKGVFQTTQPAGLQSIGMASSVVATDVNADGWPDVVVAGKWMPITILYNDQGKFTGKIPTETVAQSAGLWNTLHLVDLDQDGDDDLLAGNEGLNNFYTENMRMYVYDFDRNGYQEQLICQQVGEQFFPVHDIDELYSQLPILRKKYAYYKDMAKADMSALFTAEQLSQAKTFDLEELRSLALLNDAGQLKKVALPRAAQYSSIHDFLTTSTTSGRTEIIAGGNHYQVKPQFGRQDASLGWWFTVQSQEANIKISTGRPLYLEGQIRQLAHFSGQMIVGVNNDRIKITQLPYE